jgi:hypothetical protein
VKAEDLVKYLGHQLDTCSPTELVDLRGMYGAIRDGEATWKQVMENKAEQGGGGDAPAGESTQATAKVIPVCSDEDFKKKTPEWRKLIIEKKKSVADLTAMIETKTRLTEDQKLTIDAWSHDDE